MPPIALFEALLLWLQAIIHWLFGRSAERPIDVSAIPGVLYKGSTPNPPISVAIVWAEDKLDDAAITQLTDIMQWCYHGSLEAFCLYDPSGNLKLKSHKLESELRSGADQKWNIQIGWRDEPVDQELTCSACRTGELRVLAEAADGYPGVNAGAAARSTATPSAPPANTPCVCAPVMDRAPSQPQLALATATAMRASCKAADLAAAPPLHIGTAGLRSSYPELSAPLGDVLLTATGTLGGYETLSLSSRQRTATPAMTATAADSATAEARATDTAELGTSSAALAAAAETTVAAVAGEWQGEEITEEADAGAAELRPCGCQQLLQLSPRCSTEGGFGASYSRCRRPGSSGDAAEPPSTAERAGIRGDCLHVGEPPPSGPCSASAAGSISPELRRPDAVAEGAQGTGLATVEGRCKHCTCKARSERQAEEAAAGATGDECECGGGATPARLLCSCQYLGQPSRQQPDWSCCCCSSSCITAGPGELRGPASRSGKLPQECLSTAAHGGIRLMDAAAAVPAPAGGGAGRVRIHVLSAEDGYEPVLSAARTGGVCCRCGAVTALKSGPYRQGLDRLRSQMAQVAGTAVLVQPELVLVVGPVLTLAGFPPLQVAASEILHLGPSRGLCKARVDAALAKFLRTEQRFGS